MISKLFRVDGKDLVSALLSGVIIAVLGYLSTVTDITALDFKEILNVAILAAIASLSKSFGTDEDGKFLGAVKVK